MQTSLQPLAPAPVRPAPAYPFHLGLAAIVGRIYAGASPEALMADITPRLADEESAAGAWLDLSILRHTLGDAANAKIFMQQALALSLGFRVAASGEAQFRLLVIKTAGDFMTNTPIEFLVQGSAIELTAIYLDPAATDLPPLPPHDAAFLAISEAPETRGLLKACQSLLNAWPGPIFNNRPEKILELDRARLWKLLAGVKGLICPWTDMAERQHFEQSFGHNSGAAETSALAFPLIIRPEGAHAGTNTALVTRVDELAAALKATNAPRLNVSQYIDYASLDRQFRKYRIALIGGEAFASHMAISSHWMVHYLNAGMQESAAKRAEEAAWFESFDRFFAQKHAPAFRALQQLIGLDYFAIDCAETQAGELLVFEVDTAMIIHCMDVAPEFAYKKNPMKKLFSAFQKMLLQGAGKQGFSQAGPG